MTLTRRFSHGFALSGYFLLLVLLLIWPTWLCPPQRLPVALVLMATVVPLLFPLRGLLHGRRTSFIWAGYLSLFYFTHAVTETGAAEGFNNRLAVGLELIASVLVFLGSVFFLKTTR